MGRGQELKFSPGFLLVKRHFSGAVVGFTLGREQCAQEVQHVDCACVRHLRPISVAEERVRLDLSLVLQPVGHRRLREEDACRWIFSSENCLEKIYM